MTRSKRAPCSASGRWQLMQKSRHVAVAALCAAAVAVADASRAQDTRAQAFVGELAVVDARAMRFRIVGRDGSYIAPDGTPLASLDGKTVSVRLGPDGRVMQLDPLTVAITPITESLETIRGQLVVKDPAARTFTIQGFADLRTAPAGTDLPALGGKWVEVRIGARGEVTSLTLAPKP